MLLRLLALLPPTYLRAPGCDGDDGDGDDDEMKMMVFIEG